MVKAILYMHRRPGLSREEFRVYLREHHVPLLLRLPRLRLLVFEYAAPNGSNGAPPYDAIAEEWFENPEALQAAFASPEAESARADAASFLDMSRYQLTIIDEAGDPAALDATLV